MKKRFTIIFLFITVGLYAQFSWKNYANDHIIWDMALEDNHLWVGTQGGLIKLDVQTGDKKIYQAWNSGLRAVSYTHLTLPTICSV